MTAPSGVCFLAPAKLNISLKVFGRRPDGYHEVRTVMVPVSLYDEVTVERAPSGIEVEADDPAVPRGEANTCYRAAALFMEETGEPAGVRIRIRKRIPAEAGLGGGSSDAAAALKGLVVLTGRTTAPVTLHRIARAVGADVPFFLHGGPALVEGIGDRLSPVRWEVPFAAAIVKPPFGCPTREGYERLGRGNALAPRSGGVPSFLDWGDVVRAVENDFEGAWRGSRPEIGRLKERLLSAGAEAAGLTGSGSAVFGLFRGAGGARRALKSVPAGEGERRFLAGNI